MLRSFVFVMNQFLFVLEVISPVVSLYNIFINIAVTLG